MTDDMYAGILIGSIGVALFLVPFGWLCGQRNRVDMEPTFVPMLRGILVHVWLLVVQVALIGYTIGALPGGWWQL